MRQRRVTITNKLGLHARAAALFTKQASKFSSKVEVIKDHLRVNGKSIMELLTIAGIQGTEITIRAEGSDEELAVETLVNLVKDGFGER
ncbi:MAG TPA: HPr family phosphocarrier protein [Deltaproteobacteria bacterium]|nr:HPr family phosphocarrier protein [Deltaproteobacteria bacterium]HOM29158.1 HPr family phosphocarrier protein [Deltaproteobacteria bacterium]HPP80074.1 HPr family phosphocarrier protein [Deltaproteobacteria bacterium]